MGDGRKSLLRIFHLPDIYAQGFEHEYQVIEKFWEAIFDHRPLQ